MTSVRSPLDGPFDRRANHVLIYDPTGPGPACGNGSARPAWLSFSQPVAVHDSWSPSSVLGVLEAVQEAVEKEGMYAAGFLAYEAAPAFDPALTVRPMRDFPLAWFGIYHQPRMLTNSEVFRGLLEQGSPLLSVPWLPSISRAEYDSAIQRIKEHIAQGDTYQVNYSFRLRAPFTGDPWELFLAIAQQAGRHYAAFVSLEDWAICCASPELFFELRDGALVSRPMKGTARRGLWSEQDRQQARWLANSEKNRAENVMIVDMVRNDMGRIAQIGSVTVPSLFDVEQYPTVWQMTSTVRCHTTARLPQIFQALYPAASITGAPKVQTMKIIADLETSPRRIYTGTVGFVSPSGRAQFNVAIRTVLVDRKRQRAEYGVGGGIVWDSVDEDEYEECLTKARVLSHRQPRAPTAFALLETLRWTPDEGCFLLADHLDRLRSSAAYFQWDVDLDRLRHSLEEAVRGLEPVPHRIRLVVPCQGEPILQATPLIPQPEPYRIRLATQPVDSQDVFLYHKTTNRQVYQHALAAAPGFQDVLLWNERGEVTESCVANVVVEREGRLLTPYVRCGLLPGTYRAWLLQQGTVLEEIISKKDLRRCSRAFLVNSVRGLWEISLSDLVHADDDPLQLAGPVQQSQ